MTYLRGATRVATAVLLLVAVTSCADDGNHPSTNPSTSPSSSAPSTANPTPPSDSEVASEAASVVLRKYYSTVDRLGQQPKASLNDLSAVAVGVQLSAEKKLLESQRKAGAKQVGSTMIVKLEVQTVNLDNSDPSAGKVPTVQVDVCWDVTDVDVVDANGKSIVNASRPDTGWTRLTVANYQYATDPGGGWRVATGQDLKKAPCAAS